MSATATYSSTTCLNASAGAASNRASCSGHPGRETKQHWRQQDFGHHTPNNPNRYPWQRARDQPAACSGEIGDGAHPRSPTNPSRSAGSPRRCSRPHAHTARNPDGWPANCRGAPLSPWPNFTALRRVGTPQHSVAESGARFFLAANGHQHFRRGWLSSSSAVPWSCGAAIRPSGSELPGLFLFRSGLSLPIADRGFPGSAEPLQLPCSEQLLMSVT